MKIIKVSVVIFTNFYRSLSDNMFSLLIPRLSIKLHQPQILFCVQAINHLSFLLPYSVFEMTFTSPQPRKILEIVFETFVQ
jgi:hypothetical protein